MTSQVHSITDAPLRHSAEQHTRIVRYTVAMSIRVVCFVLAAVVGVVWHSWWAAVFVLAAAVLPYVAVVNANAGGDRYQAHHEAEVLAARPQLLTSGEQASSPEDAGAPVIPGELAEDDAEQENQR